MGTKQGGADMPGLWLCLGLGFGNREKGVLAADWSRHDRLSSEKRKIKMLLICFVDKKEERMEGGGGTLLGMEG